MNIGLKIKTLRTSKLMTQSELAGSEITRNMLSRIENGAAQPSLDTLMYLASRLNVSAGFLLADSADEQLYLKQSEINGIKNAYLSGDYRICRDMCQNSSICDDDEVQLILAECTQGIATEEFSRGNLRQACKYFDMAFGACASTIYNTDRVAAISAMYFKYMREISATLSSNYIDETDFPTYAAMNDAFCMYASDFISMRSSDEGKMYLPDADNPYSLHINAMRCIKAQQYDMGYDNLHKILVSDISIPEPMMYFLFSDLEICCREIGEFKGAYEYSNSKIWLLQKLLS